ncbi:MAG: hypothetical protein ABL865_04285 [Candidatus Nitrotoga sp.]
MKKATTPSLLTNSEMAPLFERVADILESGRGRALRTINHETVLAYLIVPIGYPLGSQLTVSDGANTISYPAKTNSSSKFCASGH